jgi:hypothetical protein
MDYSPETPPRQVFWKPRRRDKDNEPVVVALPAPPAPGEDIPPPAAVADPTVRDKGKAWSKASPLRLTEDEKRAIRDMEKEEKDAPPPAGENETYRRQLKGEKLRDEEYEPHHRVPPKVNERERERIRVRNKARRFPPPMLLSCPVAAWDYPSPFKYRRGVQEKYNRFTVVTGGHFDEEHGGFNLTVERVIEHICSFFKASAIGVNNGGTGSVVDSTIYTNDGLVEAVIRLYDDGKGTTTVMRLNGNLRAVATPEEDGEL